MEWRYKHDKTQPLGLLRVSIGLEDAEDLIKDLEQALDAPLDVTSAPRCAAECEVSSNQCECLFVHYMVYRDFFFCLTHWFSCRVVYQPISFEWHCKQGAHRLPWNKVLVIMHYHDGKPSISSIPDNPLHGLLTVSIKSATWYDSSTHMESQTLRPCIEGGREFTLAACRKRWHDSLSFPKQHARHPSNWWHWRSWRVNHEESRQP